ncbi:hypothetical protein [Mycobacterium sp. JS623]|nr:hypothetical protein [Mycobacterium sp. JS623]
MRRLAIAAMSALALTALAPAVTAPPAENLACAGGAPAAIAE